MGYNTTPDYKLNFIFKMKVSHAYRISSKHMVSYTQRSRRTAGVLYRQKSVWGHLSTCNVVQLGNVLGSQIWNGMWCPMEFELRSALETILRSPWSHISFAQSWNFWRIRPCLVSCFLGKLLFSCTLSVDEYHEFVGVWVWGCRT